ncbi:MAG: hypothetical protein JWQ76_5254 [Ramlibacter sp.]|nr:hypothetical protein [Ramlibacter sp.]
MISRRRLLQAMGAAAAAAGLPSAWAAYPDRPIRLVVPFAPGGQSDIVGRVLGQKLSERLGVPVIVENKPGASTLLAAEYVAKAPPDGYTLLVGTSSMAMLALRQQGTPVDMRRDLTPISTVAETPYVILGNPSAPFRTLPELIAYAKANPGKVSYATNGAGTPTHLVGELLNSTAGMKMVAIPYKGSGPQTMGLLAGDTQVSIDGIGPTDTHIREGKILLLATTGTSRTKAFPNVPVVAETLPGFEAKGWLGLAGPPRMPREIVDRLNRAVAESLAAPDLRERFAGMSLEAVSNLPDEYAKQIVDNVDKWARVVREAKIVIE